MKQTVHKEMEFASSTGMGEFIHTGWVSNWSCSRAKAEEAAKPPRVCNYGHLKLMWDFPDTGSPRILYVYRDLIVAESTDRRTLRDTSAPTTSPVEFIS